MRGVGIGIERSGRSWEEETTNRIVLNYEVRAVTCIECCLVA